MRILQIAALLTHPVGKLRRGIFCSADRHASVNDKAKVVEQPAHFALDAVRRFCFKAIIQNLAVWFCVRPGPTPFFAFGTPARFRVTGAASCGHYAAGAAGKKKLSPTTTNLVCDSREFATRSSPSTGYGRPPSLRAAVHCLRHYRVLTNSTDVSAVRPAAQVHTAPVHGVRRPQPCSA